MQPLVSALVPTYNGAAFIQRTLDSLAAQTWPRLEIVIADDCSTDETLAVVRRFAADRDNVTVIERTSNLGWLRNTNDLMSRAGGELMFFAFHDDVVDPPYVEKLAGALRERPSAVLAFSDLELVDVEGHRTVRRFTELETRATTLERGFAMAHRPDNWWVPNRGLFRAEAYRRVGGLHPNQAGEYSADWPWLLHLALLGDLVRVPEVLCHKYYKPGSLSKQWPHDLGQLEALKRAGRDEVWQSSIPWAHRVVLTTYMRDLPLVPRPIRRAARLLSTRLLRRPSGP
ncbi:MAG TPA: glycosyltransferase [Dermatophilaceae bacterium]|nr:glycosyltransferase [Dermatophilaceae bacterium]